MCIPVSVQKERDSESNLKRQTGSDRAAVVIRSREGSVSNRFWKRSTGQQMGGTTVQQRWSLRQDLTAQAGNRRASICDYRSSRAQVLMTGTFSPACNSDAVSSSPQLWSLLRFPVAMVVVPTLEEEAWVLVGTVATPS